MLFWGLLEQREGVTTAKTGLLTTRAGPPPALAEPGAWLVHAVSVQ